MRIWIVGGGGGSINRNASRDESVETGDASVETGDESIEAGGKHNNHVIMLPPPNGASYVFILVGLFVCVLSASNITGKRITGSSCIFQDMSDMK